MIKITLARTLQTLSKCSMNTNHFMMITCMLACVAITCLNAMEGLEPRGKRASSVVCLTERESKRQMQYERNQRNIARKKILLNRLLLRACARNDFYRSRMFLRKGANPNYQRNNWVTCLSETSDPAITTLLVQYGANPNVCFPLLDKPMPLPTMLQLMYAISNIKVPVFSRYPVSNFKILFKALLEADADPVSAIGRVGAEPHWPLLAYTLFHNLHDEFFALMKHGASPYIGDISFQAVPGNFYQIRSKLMHALIRSLTQDYSRWKGHEFYGFCYQDRPLTRLLLSYFNWSALDENLGDLKQKFLEQLEIFQASFFSLTEDEREKMKDEIEECAVIALTRGEDEAGWMAEVLMIRELDVRKIIIEAITNLVHAGNAHKMMHLITRLNQSKSSHGESTFGIAMDSCSNDEYEKFMWFAAINYKRDVFEQLLNAGAPISRARRVISKLPLHLENPDVKNYFMRILNAGTMNDFIERESFNPASYLSLLPRDMLRQFLQKFVTTAVFDV